MEEKSLFWEFLFVISFVSARNYLFKVNKLSARIRCESSSILRTSMSTIFNINDVNGVVLVSLLLILNIFQTIFQLLTLNRLTFACFILKRQTLLKTRSGVSWVMYYFKCEQILLTNSIWTYTSKPYGWISEEFLRWNLLQTLILTKKMQLTYKMTCCMYICLFTVLLARRD